MNSIGSDSMSNALADFRQAHNRAILKEIISRYTGEPVELLSYEEVRRKLRAVSSTEQGLQDIPLDAIAGSVGRYADFTRDFLPRTSSIEHRWAMVKLATDGMAGLPPIDVYKLGDVYFVKDGNHRVSVARQMNVKTIQAYVTDVQTRVPLEPDVSPDELILKAEYVEFLEHTNLDKLQPEANLTVTAAGQYPTLEEHIAVHRHYMGIEQQRFIPEEEAASHWYEAVYLKVVEPIREQGILRHFPGRTETDLYLWIAEHRAQLESELGWEIKTGTAALDLVKAAISKPEPAFSRLGARILNALAHGRLEGGPPPGLWREQKHTLSDEQRLFADILVPVSGEPSGWHALEQAMVLARREQANLNGLHIVSSKEEQHSEAALGVQAEFARRCGEAGLKGSLAIVSGEVARQIANQARLNDLVVITILYPPPSQPLARLDSGFRDLIARAPRPVLAVPQVVSPLNHALLAYDGSPKAQEALYVAAYLVDCCQTSLSVITVAEDGAGEETLSRVRQYLDDRRVQAAYIAASGDAAETVLEAARAQSADLIIMGGYSTSPVVGLMLGSVVDEVLRQSSQPVLVCR